MVTTTMNQGTWQLWRSGEQKRMAQDLGVKYLPLVNCADLKRPKKLKTGAKLVLCDDAAFGRRKYRDPYELRTTHAEMAFDTEAYKPTAFAPNQHNEEQALIARALTATLPPTPELDKCIQWCKDNHHILFYRMHKVRPVSFEYYLANSGASPSVKMTLRKTYTTLRQEGITSDSSLTASQLYEYTTRSSFVKVENDSYTSPLGRKDKAPRLIQGATPEFIVLVGPFFMALQNLLRRRWSTKNKFLCFTSGVKAEQAAEFIDDAVGEFLEDDLTQFDSSISLPWCKYELWLAKKFGAPRAVVDLMYYNMYTHGKTRFGWKYACEGTRKSGDPYTSLFNSVINGLSHLYLYCKWTGKTVQQAKNSIRMLLQGDDNLMRHAETCRFDWVAGMADLGFGSEAIYRRDRDEAEFCSNRLYPTDKGVVFGPKPGKVLSKLGYVVDPPRNVSRESLMRGIALGLKPSCKFIPPLDVVINRVLQLTEGHEAYYQRQYLEHQMKYSHDHNSTPETMCHLWDQYNWSHTVHEAFTKYVNQMQFGDRYDILSHLLFDRDTSGPQYIYGNFVALGLPINIAVPN